MIIEREPQGAISELAGYACRSTGSRPHYNPFQPVYDIETMIRVWRAALTDSGVHQNQLGAVSANGSSSVFYDRLEGNALLSWFGGNSLPVFSIKGHLGQTGAVTPIYQLIATSLACQSRVLPVTANFQEPEEGLEHLQVTTCTQEFSGAPILCHAIGFGGYYYGAYVVAPVFASEANVARPAGEQQGCSVD